jgi:hypothetical protein
MMTHDDALQVDRGEKIVNVDDNFGRSNGSTADPICCLAASERILVGSQFRFLLRTWGSML